MNFSDLRERLRTITKTRIDQGLSSRQLLQRQAKISQAHISNFLNDARTGSLPALDRILAAQGLAVEQLVGVASDAIRRRDPRKDRSRDVPDTVPVVRQSVAMTARIIDPQEVLDSIHIPAISLPGLLLHCDAGRQAWQRFVAVSVTAAQATPMHPVLRKGTIAVIDRCDNTPDRSRPARPGLFVVRVANQMLFRYVRVEASRLILRPHALDSPVDLLDLAPGEKASTHIIGRVCVCISEL